MQQLSGVQAVTPEEKLAAQREFSEGVQKFRNLEIRLRVHLGLEPNPEDITAQQLEALEALDVESERGTVDVLNNLDTTCLDTLSMDDLRNMDVGGYMIELRAAYLLGVSEVMNMAATKGVRANLGVYDEINLYLEMDCYSPLDEQMRKLSDDT